MADPNISSGGLETEATEELAMTFTFGGAALNLLRTFAEWDGLSPEAFVRGAITKEFDRANREIARNFSDPKFF